MLPIQLGEVLRKQVNLPKLPCQCGTSLVLEWSALGLRMAGSHSAAALLEHISLRVIAILLFRARKLVRVKKAPSAPLRGKDNNPRMLMVLGLMENWFDKPWKLSQQRAMNDTEYTLGRCAGGWSGAKCASFTLTSSQTLMNAISQNSFFFGRDEINTNTLSQAYFTGKGLQMFTFFSWKCLLSLTNVYITNKNIHITQSQSATQAGLGNTSGRSYLWAVVPDMKMVTRYLIPLFFQATL